MARRTRVDAELVRRGLAHPLPRPSLRAWHRARVGFLAGALATGSALLALDLAVVVMGDLAWRLPAALVSRARISATARVGRRELWLTWAGR